MEERLSREEILSRLQSEYDRFTATLARLTPEQMLEPGAVGYWSVKDLLAHLVYWNVYPVEEIEAAVRGEAFEHPEGTGDEINARAVAQYQGFDLNAVCAAFETTYNTVYETVQQLPNEAFEPDNRIEQALDETIHGALANNTYEHWPIHEQQVREWIERGMTG